MEHRYDADFWDQMYRRRHEHPHGGAGGNDPNPILAQAVTDVEPGTALDIGCGEGADALWLAKRGWRVTAVDISNVALERGRAADADHLVSWHQADMLEWQPPACAFDLVTAHYLHVPPAERPAFWGRLAQAVRPGGTLLFVAHHPSDRQTTIGRPAIPDLYFSAEEVEESLAPGRWEVLIGGTQPRSATNRNGQAITIQDMVLKVRRVE
jgi:SAM-dependent methyltransferase